jgi:hypothetical protein
MKKLLITLTILAVPFFGLAQYNWDFGVHVGPSNYLGEMGGKHDTRKDFVADMKLNKTQFALGGFARYKFNSFLSAQVGLNWIRIEGADNASTNPGRVGRNLSFLNDVEELSLTAQLFFYEMPDLGHTYRYRNDFKMYAFGGVAGFHHDPKTYYLGTWTKLQPLETEGKHYSTFQAAIPLGLGFLFTINKRHRIGWEFNWRITFTDYLDDVSGTYATADQLGNDQHRIDIANRTEELIGNHPSDQHVPSANNYTPGSKRGDPTHNDTYMSTTLYYSYVLRGKSTLYKSKYGSIFKKNKSKKRKIRAKF